MKKILYILLFFILSFYSYAGTPSRGLPPEYTSENSGKKIQYGYGSNMGYIREGQGYGIVVNTMKDLDKLRAEYEIAEKNNDAFEMDRIKNGIRKNSSKVTELLVGDYTFDNIFKRAMEPINNIASLLLGVSNYLLSILTVLEIILLIVEAPTKFPIDDIFARVVKWGFLKFIIVNWPKFINMFKITAKTIARYAAAADHIDVTPEGFWLFFATPLVNTYEDLHIYNVVWAIVTVIGLIVAALIVVELFMAELEFYVLTGFSVFLISFMAWKKTEGVGTKVIAVASSQITRLMFMYFFIQIGRKLIPNTGPFSFYTLDAMWLLIKYEAILYTLKIFVSRAPAFASAMMSGGAATSGRDITGPVGSLVSSTIGTAIGVAGSAIGMLATYKTLKAANSTKNIANKLNNAANPGGSNKNNTNNGGSSH